METSCSVPSKEMQSLLDQSANANPGECNTVSRVTWTFLGLFMFLKDALPQLIHQQ